MKSSCYYSSSGGCILTHTRGSEDSHCLAKEGNPLFQYNLFIERGNICSCSLLPLPFFTAKARWVSRMMDSWGAQNKQKEEHSEADCGRTIDSFCSHPARSPTCPTLWKEGREEKKIVKGSIAQTTCCALIWATVPVHGNYLACWERRILCLDDEPHHLLLWEV